MKKIILSTILTSTLAVSINADFLGAEAGYALWKPSLTGTIKGGSDQAINMEDDLGYGSNENNSFIWAYLDHPIPLLPNIKIQQTNYNVESSKIANISFNGTSYNTNVKSSFKLNQTDIIAYWRILDNWINLDLGIDIKNINGNIKLNTTTDKDFTVAVPLLYAKARFDLPFSGLSVEADISKISYSGNKLTDTKAAIVYQSSLGLGATFGIRNEKLVIDDVSDISTDLTISGTYLGIFYHF